MNIIPESVRTHTGHNADAEALKSNCWAPDVIWNEAMGKWCMYLSVNGDMQRSVIVLLISDDLDGAWSYMGEVVYSRMDESAAARADYKKVTGEESVPGKYSAYRNSTNNLIYGVNAIDAAVTYDENGDLWMSYGSWFGGIYMLKLDEATGLRDYTYQYKNVVKTAIGGEDFTGEIENGQTFVVYSDAYLGLHIAGGAHANAGGEGSYFLKIGDWWYLFLSYGRYAPEGGYNMRVFRSATLTGFDAKGDFVGYKDAKDNYAVFSTGDALIKADGEVGNRIMSGYTWSWWDYSYIAQGHNSAFVDGEKAYLVYHNKYTDGTIFHVLKVHELLVNADGWLVTSPFESTVQTTDVSSADELATWLSAPDIAGKYGAVYMTNNNGTYDAVATEVAVTLTENNTVSGAINGTWTYDDATGAFTLTTGGVTYDGFLLWQNLEGTNIRTLAFSAVSKAEQAPTQYTYWGYKYPTAKQQIEYYLDTLGLPAEAHAASELPTGAHTATLWDKLSINISYNAETQSLTAVSGDTTVARTIALAAYETKTENVTLGAWTAMDDFYALSDGATITLSADITKEAGASAAQDSFRGIYARIFVNGKTFASSTAGTYHYLLRPDAPVKLESVLNANDAWQFWDASGIKWSGSMANATDYYLATSGKQTWTISLNDGILTAVVKFVKTGETEPMFETTFTVKEKLEKGAFIGFGTDTATASNAQVTIPTDSDYLPSEAESVNIPTWAQQGQAVWFDIYKNTSAVVEADVQMANASAWNGLLGHVYMNGTEYSFRPDFWIFTTEDSSGNNSQALVTKATTNLDLDAYKSNMAQGIHQKVTIGYANDSIVYKIESYFNNVKFGTVIYVAEVQGNPDFIRAEIYVDGATSSNATLIRPVLQGGHVHNYTESSRMGNACTGDLVTYTCSCGDSYTATDLTGVVGHKYTVSATEATCTDPAKLTYTCSVCDDAFTAEGTPALGHDYENVQPMWTWDGYASAKATFKCTRCTHTEEETADIESEVTTEATCEGTGIRTYTATATFGEQKYTNDKTETVAALGHSWDEGSVTKPATCTEKGVKTFACTRDGCDKTRTEEIPTAAHTPEAVPGKEATCTETGLTEGSKCSVCGEVLVEQKEIPAKGHSWGEWTQTKPATCTEKGVKTRACSACDATETADIAALGHEWGTPVYAGTTLSASCTRADCTAGRSATVAFAAGDGTGEIAALTATFDGTVFTVTLPNDGMTANEGGYLLTGWTVGEESYATNVQVEIAPGANFTFTAVYTMHEHSYTAVAKVPATCEKEGVKAHFTCTCGRLFVSDGEGYTEEQPADLVISALGHDYESVQPTWEWNGYTSATATFTCTRCTHTVEVTAAITNEVTTPATCESAGVRTYTATVTFGGKQYTNDKTETVAALGHSWDEGSVTKPATCTEKGVKTFACTRDGCDKTRTEEIPAAGHTYSEEWLHDADGHWHKCESCDAVTQPEAHVWGDWTTTKEATATENGSRSRECSVCGEEQSEVIPATGTQPAPDDDPDPAPDGDPDGSVSDEGLSDGAIAGIVIGCTVGALAIAYVVLAILFKKGIVKGAFFSRIFPFIK